MRLPKGLVRVFNRFGTMTTTHRYDEPIPVVVGRTGSTPEEVHAVSEQHPLPVELKGNAPNMFVPLSSNNQLLEGVRSANSTPVDILSDYQPSSLFQTLWLIVYADGASTTRTAVSVFASLAGSSEFQIAEEVVLGGSYRVIPIQGGLNNYRIQFGNTTYPSFPDTYWRILGG